MGGHPPLSLWQECLEFREIRVVSLGGFRALSNSAHAEIATMAQMLPRRRMERAVFPMAIGFSKSSDGRRNEEIHFSPTSCGKFCAISPRPTREKPYPKYITARLLHRFGRVRRGFCCLLALALEGFGALNLTTVLVPSFLTVTLSTAMDSNIQPSMTSPLTIFL